MLMLKVEAVDKDKVLDKVLDKAKNQDVDGVENQDEVARINPYPIKFLLWLPIKY